MTLILTSIHKNGISVCSDKRYKIVNGDGTFTLEDTHSKVYKFQKIPYVIINHGINKICGKDWKVYCSEYEHSGEWKHKGHFQIVSGFKEFIENHVISELNRYHDNEEYVVGFLLGGKTPTENKYKVNELLWSLELQKPVFKTFKHQFFIITGDGKICLNSYLKNNPEILTDKYWRGIKLEKGRDILTKLFHLAIVERDKLGYDEFSDKYDIEHIIEEL